jgi:hypothetical protein
MCGPCCGGVAAIVNEARRRRLSARDGTRCCATSERVYRRMPLDPRGKRGVCRLCGEFGRLTVTHIPAKSAGNVGTRQEPMIEIDEHGNRNYALGTVRLGGMSDYWFCLPCNRDRTRPWDEEYTRWVPELFNMLHEAGSSGNTVATSAIAFDPGAFGRCLWSWFFAVADGLRDRAPAVAEGVRTGKPVAHFGYPRVFLAATRELQFSMFIGHFGGAITAPPYVAFLAGPHTRALVPGWFDTTPWLREHPGQRRSFTMTLPIIETLGEEAMPMLGHPVVD